MSAHADAEVERLLLGSVVARATRALLDRIDRAATTSWAVRELRVQLERSADTIGELLIVASATHALLVTFEPSASAPGGRYLLALAGLAAGIALYFRDHVRHLR